MFVNFIVNLIIFLVAYCCGVFFYHGAASFIILLYSRGYLNRLNKKRFYRRLCAKIVAWDYVLKYRFTLAEVKAIREGIFNGVFLANSLFFYFV